MAAFGQGVTHSPYSTPSANPLPTQSPFPLAVSTSSLASSQSLSISPAKESPSYSPSLLCRRGQEVNQEIIARTSEIFQFLRTMVLPNGTTVNFQTFHDRKAKLDEPCRQLDQLFRRMRLIYDKVNEATDGLEPQPVESLLTYSDGEVRSDVEKSSDEQKSDEERELIEQIELRNRQIKDVIDRLRTIVWEINSMMAVRRSVTQ